jgi:hypothetical protein
MKKRIVVVQGIDEKGELEEFTFDLFPNIDSEKTLHLDTNGLPKLGTEIKEGMILVGKQGQSASYDRAKLPTSQELHGLSQTELNQKYGHLWKVTPVYADRESVGVVMAAYLEEANGKQQAIVELDHPSALT